MLSLVPVRLRLKGFLRHNVVLLPPRFLMGLRKQLNRRKKRLKRRYGEVERNTLSEDEGPAVVGARRFAQKTGQFVVRCGSSACVAARCRYGIAGCLIVEGNEAFFCLVLVN